MKQERILCAATYFDDGKVHGFQPLNIFKGFVVMALNHAMVYSSMRSSVSELIATGTVEVKQGFVTTWKRFVNREEALKIAIAADQIISNNDNEVFEL